MARPGFKNSVWLKHFALCGTSILWLAAAGLTGCAEQPASDLQITRLPEVHPDLPAVPELPEAPYPIRHPDRSYTLYGLRSKIRQTIDTSVTVTAYIHEIYEPPECEEDETCPRPTAPHIWIADSPNETDKRKRLTVVGYAPNHEKLEQANRLAKRRGRPRAARNGAVPIPTDFEVGNRVKLSGRFVRVSDGGFNSSEGLIEYAGHETLTTDADAKHASP
ncbi:MAG: hypothetical protein AAF355_03040 [Myxococcota bacterium]